MRFVGDLVGESHFGKGEFGGNGRAPPGLGIDPQLATQPADPFFHAEQAQPADDPFVEAGPIVLHGESDEAGICFNGNTNIARAGMAGGIV
jgi:hypothetical protein